MGLIKMDNIKTTLIGGSGFVGQKLCCVLDEAGVDFEILDIEKPNRFKDRFKFCDINNSSDLKKCITGSIVINLAAAHRDDLPDKSEYYRINVEGSRNIVEICETLGIQHIIFLSSVAVYGFTEKPLDEDGLLKPFNDYGKSKAIAELIYRDFQIKDNSRKVTIIRPTVIFGEGNRGNVFNLFSQIKTGIFFMIGSGDNLKSMAYVDNIASFIFHAMKQGYGLQVCNYTDTPDLKVRELVDIVYSYFGKRRSKFYLPIGLGLIIGKFFDLMSSIFKISIPVSQIRVKKFTENTQFCSSANLRKTFKQKYELSDAVLKTLSTEFPN